MNKCIILNKHNVLVYDLYPYINDQDTTSNIKNYSFENLTETGVFIGSITWEYNPPILWLTRLIQLKNEIERQSRKFILLLNCVYRSEFEYYNKSLNIEVKYTAHYMIRTVQGIEEKGLDYNNKWNNNSNKFLYTLGKTDKEHRIRLLYKFHKSNLLKHCNWSMYTMNKKMYKNTRELIPELSDDGFDVFMNEHYRSLDDIYFSIDNGWNFSSNVFDYRIFADVLFRVISETNVNNAVPWITEKTWITMLNNLPFMIVGDYNMLDVLKNMGFKTFNKYLDIPNYNKLMPLEKQIDAVVNNTEVWIRTINKNYSQIHNDVTHNYALIVNIANNEISQMQLFLEQLGLHRDDLKLLSFASPLEMRWRIFYNNIKDNTWPECLTFSNLKTMPSHIQKECLEKYEFSKDELNYV